MSLFEKNFNLSDKVVLITGGAGFIGSNLAKVLAHQNTKKIKILDNFSTGNRKNIFELENAPNIEVMNGDIRNFKDCCLAVAGVDIILHHAALGSVQRSIFDPNTTHEVNANGFLNILTASHQAGVKKIIYASSSSVYGDNHSMPKRENCTGVLLSPYAVTKKINEEYANVFSKLYDLTIIGFRYFNVFGPGQNVDGPYSAVIPLFIKAMLANQAATIYGDGENSRDFTYIDNVLLANLLAVDATLVPGHYLMNVAFGSTMTLNSLHQVLSSEIGHQAPPNYLPSRKGDIRDSFADISLAKKILDYSPLVDIHEGLRRTVAWWKKSN